MGTRRRAVGRALVCALVMVPWALPARAYEAEVRATTAAQYYSFTSPYGAPIVRARRYTQTLSLRVVDIEGDPELGASDWSFAGSVRLDADFGQEPAERQFGARFIPGLRQAPLDVMFAYVDGRRLLGGALALRLGRQYSMDALGFWSWDGALVTVRTPIWVELRAFAGFEQRGGVPMLSTSRFEADGVYRGSRADLSEEQAPYYLESERPAPAYGFGVQSADLDWLTAGLVYRRVITRDTVVTSYFPDEQGRLATIDGARTSSEQIGGAAVATLDEIGALSGNAVYDVYLEQWSRYQASVEWFATPAITPGLEYDYYLPTFDADSIFNWFRREAIGTALARTRFALGRRSDLAVSSGVRWFEAHVEDEGAARRLHDYIGAAQVRWPWGAARMRASALVEAGERGERAGGDVDWLRQFDGGLYEARARLSLYSFRDAQRPTRDATSLTTVLGGGVRPFADTRCGVELEHTANRLVGQRFRLLLTLDLAVFP